MGYKLLSNFSFPLFIFLYFSEVLEILKHGSAFDLSQFVHHNDHCIFEL